MAQGEMTPLCLTCGETMTVIIYREPKTTRKRFTVAISNYRTGEGWHWQYPIKLINGHHAKTMLIALAINPFVNCVPYRNFAPFEGHPYIWIDPLTRRASVTEAGRSMMGEIVRDGTTRVQWASLRPCDLVRCSGSYLAQRASRHENIVYVVTPTGEGYAWKHPPEFDRMTAKAMLLVKVYEPEFSNGLFHGPHVLREHGIGRIFSGVVATGLAVIESDRRVRLTAKGEDFFRWFRQI